MKTILCYGDSLTWGHDVVRQTRHAFEDRWPNIVQAELGSQVHVISEGLGGRTTAFDDYLLAADLNGARSLPVVLSSHSPLDLVVVMLGTNDMKPWVNGAALGSARGMKRLTEIIRTHPYPLGGPVPKVLLVSPPHIMSIDRPDVAQMLAGAPRFRASWLRSTRRWRTSLVVASSMPRQLPRHHPSTACISMRKTRARSVRRLRR
jgi:lysophospholipase L1-like esterase